MRTKITVIGAGHVGATLTQRLAERNYADIVLVDIVEGIAQGKALDILEAGPIVGYDSKVIGTSSYELTANSDLVIVTSGLPRKPGMSRDDLVISNAKIVSSVVSETVKQSPNCILLIVSNPLDAMAQVAMKISGFPRERIIGMAGVLDTARFRTFIAEELDASVNDVQAYVLGGHGDTMVPLTRLSTVAGAPISSLMAPGRLNAIVQRARDGGAEIVDLLKTGSAYQAPSAAVAQMVDAIVLDTNQVLPASCYLQGEYGITGLFTGVPCKLGKGGLVEVVNLELTPDESTALQQSAAAVSQLVEIIDKNRAEIHPQLPALQV